jgi:hypothetical protein
MGLRQGEFRAQEDANGELARNERAEWFNLLDLEVMSSSHHVIVDGSNLATEGRMIPSLAQLDDCVQAYKAEDPAASIVVVVDATFGHRIDLSEKATYDEAIDHGELLTPPAGAVGRGDGFILKIAEKVNAVVLSNDSFQEFHGDYPWLFDEGRLIGGKPVPTIGWVFTPRSPVRGPKSRQATSKANTGAKTARQIPAKKLTVTLPDGAKPNIGDVISPPTRLPEPDVVAPVPPKKRTAKKAAPVAALAVPPEVAEGPEAPRPKKRAAKKVSAAPLVELGSSEDVASPVPEPVTPRGRKKKPVPTTTPVSATEEVIESATKAQAKKRAARGVKAGEAVALEVTQEVGPKRGGKKAAPKLEVAQQQVPTSKAQKSSSGKEPVPVNEAMGFLTFVSAHPVDSIVEGTVASFTSHGAMVNVLVEGETAVLCYAPTKHLSDPAPKSAREVLSLGQQASFRVLSLDVKRRVAELTLSV